MQENDMVHRKRTLSLPEEQDRWLDEHTINLSKFVQKCIAAEMEKEKVKKPAK